MPTLRKAIHYLLPVVLCLMTVGATGAQEPSMLPGTELARQSLRPYWHVFAAYAVVIALVMVWAGSIAKRLRDVEDRLGE